MNHTDWMSAAAEEYRRLGSLLEQLDASEWTAPTDCTEWDVRALTAHLVGAAEATASVRELACQQLRGKRLRPDAPSIDGANELQIRERAAMSPAELVDGLRAAGSRGVRARRRLPGSCAPYRCRSGRHWGPAPWAI